MQERAKVAAFDAAPMGIVAVGIDGRVSAANARFAALLGREPEQLAGVALEELFASADGGATPRGASWSGSARGSRRSSTSGSSTGTGASFGSRPSPCPSGTRAA